jgi:hypothetical protein
MAVAGGEAESTAGGRRTAPRERAPSESDPERTSTPSGGVSSDDEPSGGVAGVSQMNQPEPGGLNLLVPLILLVLLVAAILAARSLRRRPAPVAPVPVEEAKPVWVPWRRSTMTGPSWNETPPPSGRGSWASSPTEPPEPPAEREPERWSAPPSSRPARR